MERNKSKLSEEDFKSAVHDLNRKVYPYKHTWNKNRRYREYYTENFQLIPKDLFETSQKIPTFRMLSIHSHNGCNLACRGCNHHSGVLAPGSSLSIDALLNDLKILLPRINVWSHVSVLGGEGLLEPRTEEIVNLLEDYYKGSVYIKIFSNGLILSKQEDWIIEHMKKGTICRLSLHNNPITKVGKKIYTDVDNFILKAKSRGVDLSKTLEISEPWDDHWFDLLKWENNKFYPHEDNNISESFSYCTAPNVQIYSGKLWKCPSIAYLHETLVSTGQQNDEVWQKYLQYKAVPVDAPEEELFSMADEVLLPHDICNKCPANPKWYKAYRQLKGVKKVSPQIL
jgi:hypothetical protein